MKSKWFGVVALLLAVSSAVGCSSDSESGGGAALTSCNAYCDAAIAKSCTDSADCKADECADLDKAMGACDTAFKTYYDCLKAQSDVCANTCTLDLAKCQ
ncbi:MAG TPA: hypothetical protein VJV79_17225 [Polyangiaceae bacterium]|nr:hypothetical protein [Polyangiaceae bacterium]